MSWTSKTLCHSLSFPTFCTCSDYTISSSHLYCHYSLLPDGSRLGILACTIPEVITTLRGKPKLQEKLKMETVWMILIDEEITVSRNARKFGKSSFSRAYFSKQYIQQWYTEEKAHLFDDWIPATCRCCDNREDQTILHILRCSSRNEVHTNNNNI